MSITEHLTRAFGRDARGREASDIAVALGHLRAFDALVRECASIGRLDRLASRAGGIVAGALEAERSAVFILGPDGLRRVGEGIAPEGPDVPALRGLLATGAPRVFDGAPEGLGRLFPGVDVRQALALPLSADGRPVGVFCAFDSRRGTFSERDLRAGERFAGPLAHLIDAALALRDATEGRKAAEAMAAMLVGREVRMRELKGRIAAREDI